MDLCCGCPSPYQCEGTHGPSHLPGGIPSPLRRSTLPPLADGQFNVASVHLVQRWHSISSTSSPGTPDPLRSQTSDPDVSGLGLIGGESPRRYCISVPDAAGLVTPVRNILSDGSSVVSSGHRPLCDGSIGVHSSLLCLGQRPKRGGYGCTCSAMELSPGIRVSSPSPSSSRHSEDSISSSIFLQHLPPRDALLAHPKNGSRRSWVFN